MEPMDEPKIFDQLTIVPLLKKYIRDEELTALEKSAIDVWIAESESNRMVYEQLRDDEQLAADLIEFQHAESTTDRGAEKIRFMLQERKSKEMRQIIWRTAVAVLLVFFVSIYFYKYFIAENVQDAIVIAATDIEPGKDQAMLTFSDGKVVQLEGKSLTTDKNGVSLVDGQIISDGQLKYATLSTPRKGQYKTVLSDGTIVWLNAESKLKYPTQFTEEERFVELEGEGYFEVAHDKSKPFIVASHGQRVKVLGTTFNINSYANEPSVLTTLVSGSIELKDIQSNRSVKLKPGQQGKLSNSGIEVYSVDTESFKAWTSGDFQFNGIPLKEVFRQLERWYDIDVDYSEVPDAIVHGTINRKKTLSSVLFALEQITNLEFNVEKGRRLKIIR